jgi:hypothetical protein
MVTVVDEVHPVAVFTVNVYVVGASGVLIGVHNPYN